MKHTTHHSVFPALPYTTTEPTHNIHFQKHKTCAEAPAELSAGSGRSLASAQPQKSPASVDDLSAAPPNIIVAALVSDRSANPLVFQTRSLKIKLFTRIKKKVKYSMQTMIGPATSPRQSHNAILSRDVCP